MKHIFDPYRLTKADQILLTAFLLPIFVLFFHGDIGGVGLDSLNYLFGKPLEFYENCLEIRGEGKHMLGTPYPPSIYIIFSLWILPFKLAGIIDSPHNFPIFLAYWLKILTNIVFVFSAVVFYKIALFYFPSKNHAKYAAAAWLFMPIALFSQLIFSQYDIFYVLLTMIGFLMFLKNRIVIASLLFGIAITFKYFPVFVFIPLLLLFEKNILKIIGNFIIFSIPLFILELPYKDNAAYVLGVKNHASINKIYAAAMNIGCCDIYYIFLGFIIICGIAYFYDPKIEVKIKSAAYFWMVASIHPFLFIAWHPQWTIFFIPPIILTTLIHTKYNRFFILDLFGMFCLIAIVALLFQRSFGTDMFFRGKHLGIDIGNSYAMGDIFDKFGERSGNIFLTGFWSYLLLQIIVKYKELIHGNSISAFKINYNILRRNIYVGILIFLIPTIYALHQGTYSLTSNLSSGHHFNELTAERTFIQSFPAKDRYLRKVHLGLATFARQNQGKLRIEIINSTGESIVWQEKDLQDIRDNSWLSISFKPVELRTGELYAIRISSTDSRPGNAITWWASKSDTYPEGKALVDGAAQDADFLFKVVFSQYRL